MTIFYKLENQMYVNITNRCGCDCVFCIRNNGDGVGDADTLWLTHEPALDEIKVAFDAQDLTDVCQIVFCGYGEPMERADIVVDVCEYIKNKCDIPVRLNTNGLVQLIDPAFDTRRLNIMDAVSISLNADNADDYNRVTRSSYGDGSFDAMLTFAKNVKALTEVCFTVVQFPDCEKYWNETACRNLADSLGIPLRIRAYSQ
ncbi:MAG: TatD family nuclease-associated radical SAM protein [Oscillospiraceae bacterium]|nr:TatD family nuclease-associated radical SAM protein [Oscillospiraceae bacterium]